MLMRLNPGCYNSLEVGMVVTPVEKIREALEASFGIGADRTDLPDDALKFAREK